MMLASRMGVSHGGRILCTTDTVLDVGEPLSRGRHPNPTRMWFATHV